MKKALLCLALLPFVALAKPVKTADQAVNLVMKSVQKNKLLPIPFECVFFMENNSIETAWFVEVREKHDEKCGGDPETAPRLFSYSVNKQKGFLKTDAIWREDGEEFGGWFYPIDPISPVILYEQGKQRKLKYFVRGSDREIK